MMRTHIPRFFMVRVYGVSDYCLFFPIVDLVDGVNEGFGNARALRHVRRPLELLHATNGNYEQIL